MKAAVRSEAYSAGIETCGVGGQLLEAGRRCEGVLLKESQRPLSLRFQATGRLEPLGALRRRGGEDDRLLSLALFHQVFFQNYSAPDLPDSATVVTVFLHGATEAVAQPVDVSDLGEEPLPLMGDDGEEEASARDLGAAIVAHGSVRALGSGPGSLRVPMRPGDRTGLFLPTSRRGTWWNRLACSTLRSYAPRVYL